MKHTTGVASLKQDITAFLKPRIITATTLVPAHQTARLVSALILSIEALKTSVRSIARLVAAALQARLQLLYRVKFVFQERVLTVQIMDIA